MNDEITIDAEALADEIDRYLAAVELFRSLGCGPYWRPEIPSPQASVSRRPPENTVAPQAH